MAFTQTATDPPTPAAPALHDPADDTQHTRFVLSDLMDMAHAVARVMHWHITAPPVAAAPEAPPAGRPAAGVPGVPLLAAASAFDRVSRNLRHTVMLKERVGKAKAASAEAGRQRIAARKRIVREVEDVIQRKAGGLRAERLRAELAERLDGPEMEDEVGDRPVAEIVTELCRDLGIAHVEGTHPWRRRTPADIAALCALAARPAGAARGAWRTPAPEGPAGEAPPPGSGVAAAWWVEPEADEREPDARGGGEPRGDEGGGDGPRGDDPGRVTALRDVELDFKHLDDAELDRLAAAASEAEPVGSGDPGGIHDPGGIGSGDPGGVHDPGGLGGADTAPARGAAHPVSPPSPTADFCDYEPGARAWVLPTRGFSGPVAPEATRPSGRASFRGG